jgi:acetylornithine/N-succinyldiaminopimelate aminotransferase
MSLQDRDFAALFHTYKRLPIVIERGQGMYLYTADGRRLLDMFSGLAVNALGYGHPEILRAIREQSERYIHLSNYYLQEPQIRLAELLVHNTGYPRVFFANSGTEASEAALKIARKWGSTRGKKEILSVANAFHGRTFGALSLMDRPKYREGFGPFLEGFRALEQATPAAVRAAVNQETAAIMLEFVQGEGGIRPVSLEFVEAVKELQRAYGFLLIADEVQSGVGRTGLFFGFEHFDVQPDLVTLAKPIGGGLPLGAVLGRSSLEDILQPGMHGTTFGGNPVACAAGIAVVHQVTEGGLMKNASAMGQLLKEKLLELQREFPRLVKEVRGLGLMVGAELTREGDSVVAALRDRNVLINCTDTTVLRFLPPLIVARQHIEETASLLRQVFAELSG